MNNLLIKIFILILLVSAISYSQESGKVPAEFGLPFIKNFGAQEFHINSEFWCITQDKRGMMYFGNNNGVLEYDGSSWRLIKLPNNSAVRSLAMDKNGRIYVTGSSDFGYLAPDSTGQLIFFSLRQYMENNSEKFGEVWDVVTTSDGVYFKTLDKVYHWDGTGINIIEPVNSYRLYVIEDEAYARDDENGLVKISGDSALLIPHGETFANTGVYNMKPFGSQILITTSTDGLFLYDGIKFSPFKTDADLFFKEHHIYNVCELKDGNFAFALRRGGVVIMDKQGHLIQRITSANGLTTDAVFDVFQDNQGGLWLATNEGITRVEISSPFKILPKNNTGKDYITNLYRFRNNLFASNVYGIFYLDKSLATFNAVSGVNSTGSNFVSIGNSLYSSTINMVCEIDKHLTAKNLFDFNNAALYRSSVDSNIIYAIDRIGLAILEYHNGTLQLLKETIPIKEELLSLVEDSDGSLWILTFYEGLIHMRNNTENVFSNSDTSHFIFDRYNKENGLPGTQWKIYSFSGKTHFATDVGLFQFNPETKSFTPDSILGVDFTNSTSTILYLKEDYRKDLWILVKKPHGNELGKAVRQEDGKYLWQPDPALRRLDLTNVLTIYPDYDSKTGKECLWISTHEGLIHYNPAIKQFYTNEFPTFIRGVKVNQDSLIYGGTTENTASRGQIVFSSEISNVGFQFSASSYDRPQANQFQYLLEGNDEEWSQWTSEAKTEYTNLSAGDYVFRVHSKNVYGVTGSEDSFSFTILPPWYLSWWAYLIYVLIFLGILYQIRRLELIRVNRKHAMQLELVEFSKLKELDQLKSQFFANISHEFRTPLTLILGQTESVMSSNIEIKEKGKLQVANKNARRLLTLINELLDLSKLEAGGMELKAQQHNIVSFLKSLFYSFESLAESQKITLTFESEKENIPVLFEPDKMEKVFYNLLSNAFKFTSAHGEIKVSIKIVDSSQIEITVKDNGKGIPADQLPHIFNRFYQADSSITRENEGTGIGLSLTKELIELHKGTISVNSVEGQSSSFTILLPFNDLKNEKVQEVELPQVQNTFDDSISDFETNDQENEPVSVNPTNDDKKEIILIVEDNSDVRAYINEQLVDEYRVIEAYNGEEGIIKAEEYIPDLIITDVMMPKMDGYQFSKEMSQNEKTSHIPIIMLTAKASLDDKIEGLETGVDAYLTKPFSAKELQVRVKNLISQRQQLRQRFSTATIIKPSEVSAVSADQQFLEKTVSTIEAFFYDENFNADKLASEVNMSLSQLNRKLKALIDQPSGQLIRSLRLQRAADLLKKNAGTVAEICYKVGFNDQAYFSRAFKKQFGCPPSEYKNTI